MSEHVSRVAKIIAERDAWEKMAVRLAREGQRAKDAMFAYDSAMRRCVHQPERMTGYQTAQGDDLDALYCEWLKAARGLRAALDAFDTLKEKGWCGDE